jgi:hypothetical protein
VSGDIPHEDSKCLESEDSIEGGSMKLVCIILLLVLLLSGCVVTQNLTTEPQNTVLTQVNEQFGGEIVTITTTRNRVYRGLFRGIAQDSLRYVNDLYQGEALPTSQVYKMQSAPGSSGPIWMGLGVTVAGALIGAVIGASEGEPDPTGGIEQLVVAPMEGVAGTVKGAVVGGLIGLPVGVIVGSYVSAGHEVILNKQ